MKAEELKAEFTRRGRDAIAELQLSPADASLVEFVIARQAEVLITEAAGGDVGDAKKVIAATMGNLTVAARVKASNALSIALSGILVTVLRGVLVRG